MGKNEADNTPTELITSPHAHDVLCGRGGLTNQHSGNEWYRRLVRSNRALYRSCPKHTKLLVSKAIVQAVQQQDPPGRFLEIFRPNSKSTGTNTGSREPNPWKEISYKRAVDKTSQALREREAPNAGGAPDNNAILSKNQQLQQQEQYLSDLTKITLEAAGLSTPKMNKPPPVAASAKKPPGEFTPEGILTEGTSDDSVDGSRGHSLPTTLSNGSGKSPDCRKRKASKDFVKPSWWNQGAPPKKSKWEQNANSLGELENEVNPLPLPPQPLQARQSSMFRFLSQTGIFGSGGASNVTQKPAPIPASQLAAMSAMKATKAMGSLLDDDDDDDTTAVANLMKMKAPPAPQDNSNFGASSSSIPGMAIKAFETKRRRAALPSSLKPAALMAAAQANKNNNSPTLDFMQQKQHSTSNNNGMSVSFSNPIGMNGQNGTSSQHYGNNHNRNNSYGSHMSNQEFKTDLPVSNSMAANADMVAEFERKQQSQGGMMNSSVGNFAQSFSNVNSGMGLGGMPADTSNLSPQEQIELLQKQIEMQQQQLQNQHMRQLQSARNRGSFVRKQTIQQIQEQQNAMRKFQNAQDDSDEQVIPPAIGRLTSQVSDWLTTFWPVGKGPQKDQAKTTADDSSALEPTPLPPSRDRAPPPVASTAAALPQADSADDADIPPALEAGVSSSIFKLVSSPSAMLSNLKSGVSSYFDFSSNRTSFMAPGHPIPNGGNGPTESSLQRPSMPVVMGTTAKRSASLLDDYEETPMESRLRSVSSR